MYLQHMLLKIRKKTIWKFTFSKYPKLPISITIPITLLQIDYICMTAISKFEFMNYLFANLLVAWL